MAMSYKLFDVPRIEVIFHETARDFLSAVLPALSSLKQESAANTILPHALEKLSFERNAAPRATHIVVQKYPIRVFKRVRPAHFSTDQFWLTCWSLYEGADPALDIVLSCTYGPFGNHPIFLYSNNTHLETRPFLVPRLHVIISSLLKIIPVTRLFSVFGPAPLVNIFSKQWLEITGQQQEPQPLYSATFAHATRETLTTASPPPPGDHMRRATLRDTDSVGRLFKEFSDSSVYYPLSYEQSIQGATQVISKRQAWVYETQEGYIPSVVAVTRSSPNVAVITKVYTAINWRNRGYAERLMNRVTRELLYSGGKQCVVLYVGHHNPAAKVYHRVGFVGLGQRDVLEGSDEWLEIGFQGTHRGHW